MYFADTFISLNTILFAVAGGILPTLLWLLYWLSRTENHEPRGLIALSFIIGALTVPIVIPLQRLVHTLLGYSHTDELLFVVVIIEELAKFAILRAIVLRKKFIRYRSDYIMYLIATALGFAAVENTLYLITPLSNGDLGLFFLTGNMRFFGATIIHAVSSGLFGLWIALSIDHRLFYRTSTWIAGLISAVILHGLFNYFIIHENSVVVTGTLAVLWVVFLIISHLFHRSEIPMRTDSSI